MIRTIAGTLALSACMALAGLTLPATTANAQIFKKKKPSTEVKDSTSSPYKTITGSDSTVCQGLFNVFKKKGEYYFEIPLTLMQKDMLVVNRLLRVPSELNEAGVNRGVNYETMMVRMEMSPDSSAIFLRQQRPEPVTPTGDILSRSVADNYISPIIARLKIEARNGDKTTAIVKVSDFFNGKSTTLNSVFNKINLGTSAKSDLSYIEDIRAYDNNVMAKSLLTTQVIEGKESVNVTVEVASTIVLLPEVPMQPRLDNQRIGYFTSDHLFYSDRQQQVGKRNYITRWRLEPKDTAAYLRGELTEPVKPILFYVDGNVPERWRPYLEQGITDWNAAFEKAGFKNAIQMRFLPDSTSQTSDDINHNTLMYAASTKQNAMGPSTLDPRTGEILEADIMWWHNVMVMLQEWITVQTGTVCRDAQTMTLPDNLMGDAMRYVICHEVGHSLGLRHNMIGSWAIAVDSLRSKQWTDTHAYNASSIMDYARYNYVAQPGDGVTRLAPHLGPYDYLAIEYGYRWYGNDRQTEKQRLQQLLDRHTGNMYKFSEAQSVRDCIDPRAQMEDLGDDAVKASTLGIKNLKIVAQNIIPWTATGEKGQSYEEASRLYYTVANQWNNYLYHVMANIGGLYIENTAVGDGQRTFTYVPRSKQKEAMAFLLREAFTFPKWLFANGLSDYTFLVKQTPNGPVEQAPTQVLKNAQAYILYDLLNNNRLMRMLENESVNGTKAYTAVEMMNDLHRHIFATTISGSQPDVMTRNLQKLFVDALITAAAKDEGIKVNKKIAGGAFACNDNVDGIKELVGEQFLCPEATCACPWMDTDRAGGKRELDFYGSQVNRTSDALSVKRGELLKIKELLSKRTAGATEAVKFHYKDIIIRINNALEL